ncbi:MAG: ubiquinone biosynthesis monooxygenase Coq6 [Bacillariaceae sp.]|jgi:ubiquinone biosynthesis monooxygenase Coq6
MYTMMIRGLQRVGGVRRQRSHCFSSSSFSASASASSSSVPNTDDIDFFDVTIVGGGVVGLSLANLLRRELPNLKVALIDSKKEPPSLQPAASVTSNEHQRVPNPRSYALSPRSFKVLGSSIESKLSSSIGYYNSMQVWQDSSPATLTFTTKDLDPDPNSNEASYLGGCCEDQTIVSTLWEDIMSSSKSPSNNTELMINTTIESINNIDGNDSNNLISVETNTNNGTTTTRKFNTAVLVGADGGNSFIRKSSGISQIGPGSYNQNALTFTVELENNKMNKNGRAYQRYLSDGGPIALLPTYSSNHAVIVWSTTQEVISKWKNSNKNKDDDDDEDLVQHLNDCLREGPQRIPPLMEGAFSKQSSSSTSASTDSNAFTNLIYGAERVLDTVHYGMALAASQQPGEPIFQIPPKIISIASQKFTFPLSCYQASTYVKNRVALVGDAAHTVHPMAGQGLNLGLADVDTLVTKLKKAHDAGMDLSSFLNEYNTDRHKNVSISLTGIHALQKLFVNTKDVPIQHVKTFGMNMIQNIGPLRRQLAIAAAYGVGV